MDDLILCTEGSNLETWHCDYCGLGKVEYADPPVKKVLNTKAIPWLSAGIALSKKRTVANKVHVEAIWPKHPPIELASSIRLSRDGKKLISNAWKLLVLLENLRTTIPVKALIEDAPRVGFLFKRILCDFNPKDLSHSCRWQTDKDRRKPLMRLRGYLSTTVRIASK